MRRFLLALLVWGAPFSAGAMDAPPTSVPDNFSASEPSISFTEPSIGFTEPSIGFTEPAISFEEPRMLSAEEMAFAPQPVAAAPPPVEGLAVTEEADGGVRYTLSADILFDFDKATLRPAAEVALRALSADVRARFPQALFVVEGHTDAKGSDGYNLKLSARRAESVKSYLVGSESFAADAITAAALGESRPVAPNALPDGTDDPEGRQKNRRVEIVVRPAS